MGTHPYILSHVMLEEHRQIVERNMLNPDWPAPVRMARRSMLKGIRRRLGAVVQDFIAWSESSALASSSARATRTRSSSESDTYYPAYSPCACDTERV
jgi:hypothetical protein